MGVRRTVHMIHLICDMLEERLSGFNFCEPIYKWSKVSAALES